MTEKYLPIYNTVNTYLRVTSVVVGDIIDDYYGRDDPDAVMWINQKIPLHLMDRIRWAHLSHQWYKTSMP